MISVPSACCAPMRRCRRDTADDAMRIDAHQHYWQVARGDYGWLTPDLAPIYRDFMPADLAPLLAAAGIDLTIAVQAAPTEAETVFLLDLAATTPSIAGVVGWTDFDSPDAPARIAEIAANPLLVGLRPMIHDIADPDWMLSPAVGRALNAMEAEGLVFDALIRPPHVTRLMVLATRHPGLAIVVDHGAKPLIAKGTLEPWASEMRALARHPNVTVKLSGMVTEAAPGWKPADLAPYVSVLLDAFGPERVLFGSDWPVLNLAGDYASWVATVENFIAPLTPAGRAAIMGRNAARIYLTSRGRN
jgi:L-fuconolactonase